MTRSMLLSGAAAALAFTVPALAQEPPGSTQAQASAEAQSRQTLTLQPGASVVSPDGAVLGILEGVRTTASGEQQLAVRGADGQVRGVSVAGVSRQGANVAVGLTADEFASAEIVAEAEADAAVSARPDSVPPTPPTLPQTPADEIIDDVTDPLPLPNPL